MEQCPANITLISVHFSIRFRSSFFLVFSCHTSHSLSRDHWLLSKRGKLAGGSLRNRRCLVVYGRLKSTEQGCIAILKRTHSLYCSLEISRKICYTSLRIHCGRPRLHLARGSSRTRSCACIYSARRVHFDRNTQHQRESVTMKSTLHRLLYFLHSHSRILAAHTSLCVTQRRTPR